MKTPLIKIILIVCAIYSFGCNPFEFEGEITVQLIDDQIQIENLTNTTVYYDAIDSTTLSLINRQYSTSNMSYLESGHICTIDIENVSYFDDETTGVTVYWLTKHGDQGTVSVEL